MCFLFFNLNAYVRFFLFVPAAGLDVGTISDDSSSLPHASVPQSSRPLSEDQLDGILSPELDKMVTDGKPCFAVLNFQYMKIPYTRASKKIWNEVLRFSLNTCLCLDLPMASFMLKDQVLVPRWRWLISGVCCWLANASMLPQVISRRELANSMRKFPGSNLSIADSADWRTAA